MPTEKRIWRLSPSGLYGFEECKACFWLDHHHGKAPSLPWLLNSAMDSILKSRYDAYREKGKLPPEAQELVKEHISFFTDKEKLDKWRGHSSHLKVAKEDLGFELTGKIDDVLVEKDGRLIPTDFKSSGYAPKDDKKKYYILQLNAYAYMFRHQGFRVSDRGILLHYFVKDAKNPSLSVEFASHIDWVDIDTDAFERKLCDMVALLNGPYLGDGSECEKCVYYAGREKKK